MRLDLSVNMEALRDSINMVLHEHDIFRCRFLIDEDTGDIKQRFDGEITEIGMINKKDVIYKMQKDSRLYEILGY